MTRLNITLPDEIVKQLSGIKNKSHFIAELLKEKFEQDNKKRLEYLLAKGYKSTEKEDKELNKDWEKASLEKWD